MSRELSVVSFSRSSLCLSFSTLRITSSSRILLRLPLTWNSIHSISVLPMIRTHAFHTLGVESDTLSEVFVDFTGVIPFLWSRSIQELSVDILLYSAMDRNDTLVHDSISISMGQALIVRVRVQWYTCSGCGLWYSNYPNINKIWNRGVYSW